MEEGQTDLPLQGGTRGSTGSEKGRQDTLLFVCPVDCSLIASCKAWGLCLESICCSRFIQKAPGSHTPGRLCSKTCSMVSGHDQEIPIKSTLPISPKTLTQVTQSSFPSVLTYTLENSADAVPAALQAGGNKVIF